MNILLLICSCSKATIQRLKDAYQHAAMRLSADRSRCEQALAAEKHVKDLLRKQNTKFQDVEAEMERLIAKHKAKQNAIQNEVNESKSKVSNLMSEVQDRDIQISAFERKVKSILEERDDLQLQLMESNRKPARADERNSHLQTKLDEADDAIRKARRSTEKISC